jgi:hypothetical protein
MCAQSLRLSLTFIDTIMFIITTDSFRTPSASRIMEQITDVITSVPTNHPDLGHSNSVAVVPVFHTITCIIYSISFHAKH